MLKHWVKVCYIAEIYNLFSGASNRLVCIKHKNGALGFETYGGSYRVYTTYNEPAPSSERIFINLLIFQVLT